MTNRFGEMILSKYFFAQLHYTEAFIIIFSYAFMVGNAAPKKKCLRCGM